MALEPGSVNCTVNADGNKGEGSSYRANSKGRRMLMPTAGALSSLNWAATSLGFRVGRVSIGFAYFVILQKSLFSHWFLPDG